MTDMPDAITLYAYARADTPPTSGTMAVSQIAELYEFGLIGPGSTVWCNLEIQNAMWVLAETSFYLQIVDVPFAGWARLTKNTVVWGRGSRDTSEDPRYGFDVADVPIEAADGDIYAVAYRNSDPQLMRAQFRGTHQHFDDYVVQHANMRVVDLKTRGVGRRVTPIGRPSELVRSHAMQRGLALMQAGLAATGTQGRRRRLIEENFDAFSTVISADDLHRIRARQQSLDQAAQGVTDRIIERVAALPGFGGEESALAG